MPINFPSQDLKEPGPDHQGQYQLWFSKLLNNSFKKKLLQTIYTFDLPRLIWICFATQLLKPLSERNWGVVMILAWNVLALALAQLTTCGRE